MQPQSLKDIARSQLQQAQSASSGRSSHTVLGGHDSTLRQTVIALAGGQRLDDHENPGEASVHVLVGRVRITGTSGGDATEGAAGDLLIVPDERHALEALEPSVVLLTVAKLS